MPALLSAPWESHCSLSRALGLGLGVACDRSPGWAYRALRGAGGTAACLTDPPARGAEDEPLPLFCSLPLPLPAGLCPAGFRSFLGTEGSRGEEPALWRPTVLSLWDGDSAEDEDGSHWRSATCWDSASSPPPPQCLTVLPWFQSRVSEICVHRGHPEDGNLRVLSDAGPPPGLHPFLPGNGAHTGRPAPALCPRWRPLGFQLCSSAQTSRAKSPAGFSSCARAWGGLGFLSRSPKCLSFKI